MEVYGLIGNPVGHSLSPPLHEAAYDALGMDARYVTFEPEKTAAGDAIHSATILGIAGLNVTIPFKQAVLDHVDPDPLASRIGAVNTISFSDPAPAGTNTDAVGARRALQHHGVSVDGATVVVIGAGGAGRAIAFGLADAGADVRIANRTTDRAEELATVVPRATSYPLGSLTEITTDADVLVNATSVGMGEDVSIVPGAAFHSDLTVMDAVYHPVETRLLRDALARGAKTIDGGWMLLYQGVAAFEEWTGVDAPVEEMNAALRERL